MMDDPGIFVRGVPSILSLRAMNTVQLKMTMTIIKLFLIGLDEVSFSEDKDGQEEDKNRIGDTVNC